MTLTSVLQNMVTGRGRPHVTGKMQFSEVERLDRILNEVPSGGERQALRAAGIQAIHGTYRSPHYILEGVSGSRPTGPGATARETIKVDAEGRATASISEQGQATQEIDISSVIGGDAIVEVLSAIYSKALRQGVGGAR